LLKVVLTFYLFFSSKTSFFVRKSSP